MFGKVLDQGIAVGLAAFLVTERVDLQDRLAGDAEGFQNVPAAGDDLGVGERFGRADQLDVDLVELAVATLLGALVTEHRAGAEDLLWQRLGEAVGHKRAAEAGGGLRTQGDVVAAAVRERIHLLHHHVGGLAEGAGEHAGVLEDRRGPLVEAVGGGDAAGGVDHVLMAALVLADQVVGAAGGLEFGGHARPADLVACGGSGKLAGSRQNASTALRLACKYTILLMSTQDRVMPLNIRDEDTNRLAEKLASRMRSKKTAAVKSALRNELDRLEEKVPLRQRLRPLQDRVMSRASTGLEADKAFYDGLSGHSWCSSMLPPLSPS